MAEGPFRPALQVPNRRVDLEYHSFWVGNLELSPISMVLKKQIRKKTFGKGPNENIPSSLHRFATPKIIFEKWHKFSCTYLECPLCANFF